MNADEYELLDSGDGRKLERFGPVVLIRPCAQALWAPFRPAAWSSAQASFDREGGLRWHNRAQLPSQWTVRVADVQFRLMSTDFGHLGIFPEQRAQWLWIREKVRQFRAVHHRPPQVMNLFAYSGGATLAAAAEGAEVCHVDASKGMVQWARDNAALNRLDHASIRWIVDDVHKFLAREVRRERRYDAIILDPPSFGRGKQGEVYKFERDLRQTLDYGRTLLSNAPAFFLLTAHTPGVTPIVLQNILAQTVSADPGCVECGEMLLTGAARVPPLPSGAWARWSPLKPNRP